MIWLKMHLAILYWSQVLINTYQVLYGSPIIMVSNTDEPSQKMHGSLLNFRTGCPNATVAS